MARWRIFDEKPRNYDVLLIAAGFWTAASSASPLWVRVPMGLIAAYFTVNRVVHCFRQRRERARTDAAV
ncbi:hypothetical protein ACFY9H_28740 [Streptomyces bacillaris]|uniref:Uncharacterized protein n=1 Tax=Streptomyces cavourensis TaxID=67258 RepID=A0AAD0Q770_9ACTN|nr:MULTISPECIES: hypothetical protein [Streptomyces]NUW23964.1 hypothetical protein [Streptomyces roseoviolaceus]ATY97189.1 hypothetical protein CVT27_18350 [Streptomyces cavourensis]AXI73032.1 hypothetical protein DTW94_18530 [Streptomyces cavourensis]MBH0245521.1 hypothetical protein [Streptomyces cavourensis]NUV42879.1 hypothetical protein [Streptomyces sp. CAI-24]